ncbi:hypothetical protein [Halobacillus sp. B23F22_1]|uniref:hypothetical protein n=1 Tax=Halobacillus sp. B23F22_1 TaxID=3459514 RepID=UPI00373E6B96
MKSLKRKYVWIWPSLIIFLGIALLYYENYQKVTEPPSEEWSRELELGLTPFTNAPVVKETESGINAAYLTNHGVHKISYDENISKENESSFSIPYNKWTKFYLSEDHLIYSDYYTMYNGKTNDKIADINQFIPLEDSIIFQENLDVNIYNPASSESVHLLTLENEKMKIHTFETKENTYLLTEYNGNGNTALNFYNIHSDEINKIGSSKFTTKNSEDINDLQFTIQDGRYALLLTTYEKRNMSGSPTNYYYYAKQPLNEDPEFNELHFKDPYGHENLSEISDITLDFSNNTLKMLFKGYGQTETLYKSGRQFNIYEAELKESSPVNVTRLSNTPKSSASPQWVNDNTIAWLDMKGDENQLLLASTEETIINKSIKVSGHYFMNALGKTLGMLSFSFLTLIVALIWFIWPMVFMLFIMFGRSSALDHDRSWVFFSGASIYLLAAFFFKGKVFTPGLMARAPEYLSFLASPFVYILLFALLAYIILAANKKSIDWSVSVKLTYFICIHLLFITIFFGPYLL